MSSWYEYTGVYKLDTGQTLDSFLREVERRAYRMAVIATGDREEALDIVQEAMFKLVRRYRDRSAEEWGPLFHRILQSSLYDWYRRHNVRQRLRAWLPWASQDEQDVDPVQGIADPRGVVPSQALQQQQAIVALDKALHDLPLRQQQAFLLRQWEGLDVAQTAQAMGCSEGSVKTHYSRAVRALRQQLEGHWP